MPIIEENPDEDIVDSVGNEIAYEALKANDQNEERTIHLYWDDPQEPGEKPGEIIINPEFTEKDKTLKKFQKDGGIQAFFWEQTPLEVGDVDFFGVLVTIHLIPKDFLTYIRRIYLPKLDFYRKLASYLESLIDIVTIYSKNQANPDKEKLNFIYLRTTREIEAILQNAPKLSFRMGYKQPFSDLFSAPQELSHGLRTVEEVLVSLNAYYGKIHRQIAFYHIEEAPFEVAGEVKEYLKELKKGKYTPKDKTSSKELKTAPLFTPRAEPINTEGNLRAYTDGTIRYIGKNIEMRGQLKELCRLFLENPNRLVTLDDISEKILRADRRTTIPFKTISKYVSELHNIIRPYYGKEVLHNQRDEGWYFNP